MPFSHNVLPYAEAYNRLGCILHVRRYGLLSVGCLGPVVGCDNSWRHGLPQSFAQFSVRKPAGRHRVDICLFTIRHLRDFRQRGCGRHCRRQVPFLRGKPRLLPVPPDRAERECHPERRGSGPHGNVIGCVVRRYHQRHQCAERLDSRKRDSNHSDRRYDHHRCAAQFDVLEVQSGHGGLRRVHYLHGELEPVRFLRHHRHAVG